MQMAVGRPYRFSMALPFLYLKLLFKAFLWHPFKGQ